MHRTGSYGLIERTSLVDRVCTLFYDESNLVVLWGRPGVGKTALRSEIETKWRRRTPEGSTMSLTWAESQERITEGALVDENTNLVFIHDFEQAVATAQTRCYAKDRLNLLRRILPAAKIVLTSRRKPFLKGENTTLYGTRASELRVDTFSSGEMDEYETKNINPHSVGWTRAEQSLIKSAAIACNRHPLSLWMLSCLAQSMADPSVRKPQLERLVSNLKQKTDDQLKSEMEKIPQGWLGSDDRDRLRRWNEERQEMHSVGCLFKSLEQHMAPQAADLFLLLSAVVNGAPLPSRLIRDLLDPEVQNSLDTPAFQAIATEEWRGSIRPSHKRFLAMGFDLLARLDKPEFHKIVKSKAWSERSGIESLPTALHNLPNNLREFKQTALQRFQFADPEGYADILASKAQCPPALLSAWILSHEHESDCTQCTTDPDTCHTRTRYRNALRAGIGTIQSEVIPAAAQLMSVFYEDFDDWPLANVIAKQIKSVTSLGGNPTNLHALTMQAIYAWDYDGNAAEADRTLQQALERYTKSDLAKANALVIQGGIDNRLGRWKQAIERYDGALQIYKHTAGSSGNLPIDRAVAQNNRGRTLHIYHGPAEAAAAYGFALRSLTSRPDCLREQVYLGLSRTALVLARRMPATFEEIETADLSFAEKLIKQTFLYNRAFEGDKWLGTYVEVVRLLVGAYSRSKYYPDPEFGYRPALKADYDTTVREYASRLGGLIDDFSRIPDYRAVAMLEYQIALTEHMFSPNSECLKQFLDKIVGSAPKEASRGLLKTRFALADEPFAFGIVCLVRSGLRQKARPEWDEIKAMATDVVASNNQTNEGKSDQRQLSWPSDIEEPNWVEAFKPFAALKSGKILPEDFVPPFLLPGFIQLRPMPLSQQYDF